MTEAPRKVNGKNVLSLHQFRPTPNMEHVVYQIPATTQANFSGTGVYDFRTPNIKVLDLMLEIIPSAITGITSPPTNYPCYSPCDFWIRTLEIVVNGRVLENKMGLENWLNTQIMYPDEKRIQINDLSGPYNSVSQRFLMSNGSTAWYLPLNTFINQMPDGFDIFNNTHEIQLRINFSSPLSIVSQSSGTGVPVCSILSSKLIVKATKFGIEYSIPRLMYLQKQPIHYLMDECKQAPFAVTVGSNNISIPLAYLKGEVVYMYFVVQDNTLSVGENLFNFVKIKDFEILSSNNSLTGGSPISHALNQINIKKWSQSSYITESVRAVSNSNVYMWCFTPDVIRGFYSGVRYGHKEFNTTETLRINFNSPITNPHTVTVMAFTNMTIGQTYNSVTKTED